MHDRNGDDKEESEYRFSDDDASYEAEHHEELHPSEPVVPVSAGSGNAGMKRMVIGGAVVIALIAVVYKFVAPTSSLPSTDIVESSTTQQSGPMQANVPAMTLQATASQPSAHQAAVPQAQAVSQPVMPLAATPQVVMPQATAPAAATQVAAAPLGLPAPGSQTQTAAAVSVPPLPASTMAAPTSPMPAPAAPSGTMQASTTTPAAGTQFAVPTLPPSMTTDVIPMQSAATAQSMMQGSGVDLPQNTTATNAKITNLEAQSAQLMSQLQEVYTQKLSDFSTQNKALQDQVQTLNSRVASLENELKQMVQMLQQAQRGQPTSQRGSTDAAPTQQQTQIAEAATNYNVQAIIPGRAWLRAKNGETVTVAEGDVVHDLGRITKIDPYDGVVEINTGNKVVSLSYGNAG